MKSEGKSLWTYTAYTLWKFFETQPQLKGEIEFRKLKEIFFDILFKESKVVWLDGPGDLLADLLFLKRIGVIDLEEDEAERIKIRLKDKGKLNGIAQIVKNSPRIIKVELNGEYTKRIDEGIESLAHSSFSN